MISALLYAFERGLKFVKNQPQLLFALFLLVVLPVAFLYTALSFSGVAKENTNTLRYQRIGTLNDVFASVVVEAELDPVVIQRQIESIAKLNGDISKFRVVVPKGDTLVQLAALDTDKIQQPIEDSERKLYEMSFGEPSGITFPYYVGDRHFLQSFRAVKENGQLLGYILIETEETSLEQMFSDREFSAYVNMAFLFVFLIALAYWLTRLTNYQHLYQEVKKANEMKDLFTNMIAHELRAPLTAIKGYSSLSLEAAENNESKKYSERIRLSSERLLNIVNDLLDVARIQSGKLTVENSNKDVLSIVTAVMDELRISANEKGIQLDLKAEPGDYIAWIDDKRLHQAITNLVSNAIKYTNEGTITLNLIDKKHELELRVEDTGMGISAEDQKKLFAPFFRVQNDDVSAITGTGLGMWITKQLIELMGATIGVESIKGVGTHIVVKISKQPS